MKSIFLAGLSGVLLSFPALAQQTNESREVLSCVVPVQDGGQSVVSLNVSVSSESSADFVVVALTDRDQTTALFTQMGKGEFANSLQSGQLGFLLLEDGFALDSGVIRNAGFIIASKTADGVMQGMLSAKGNIYPLTCQIH